MHFSYSLLTLYVCVNLTLNFSLVPPSMCRHPRQRSRVRKLQYIAELDRTVNDLQVQKMEVRFHTHISLMHMMP